MKKLTGALLLIVINLSIYAQSKYTISGYVSDILGEELIGATVYINELGKGTITNTYGFYSLTLPAGSYSLSVAFIGFKTLEIPIKLSSNQKVDVDLEENTEMIESVEIRAEKRDVNIKKVEMSTNKLPMKTIQKLPVVFGETDILKSILLLPGVISSSEASGGFHVRGGSADQNLILLDNATVYNASHLMGFFSVFNTDAIKDVKLYKGGIPAEYGGRLSSILDIHLKEGNKSEYNGNASIGLISSKLTLEGPIIKNKMSFLVSGRRTYADLFTAFSQDSLIQQSGFYFYDLNAKINYSINENNRLFLSGYFGRDVFKFADFMDMDYGNFTITGRWNHVFNNRLFLNTSTIYSNYKYELGFSQDLTSVKWSNYINDINQRLDFTYYLNPENTITFGAQAIKHDFSPGAISGQLNDTIPFDPYKVPNTYSWEYGLYLSNEQELTPRLSVQYGLRYSFFQNIGNGISIQFDKTNPQDYAVLDTIHYSSGKIFNSFNNGFEPRLSLRYTLNNVSSVKAGYNRMIQYIHLASNSTASLPLDFWFPSSPNIKPQIADQFAVGYFRNFKDNMFETSIEVFYKNMKNSIDFRDHAQLLLNYEYEGELRVGKAWSYGAEFQIKKQVGKLTGWISYTYSRTFKKIPEINKGEKYQASYDKPHNFAIVLSWDITERFNVSANWIYTSAPPRTLPSGRIEYGSGMPGANVGYNHNNLVAPVYTDRNTERIFPYHRLDFSSTLRLNKIKKRFEQSLNFSLYNAYSRHNTLYINFKQDEDGSLDTHAYKTYLYTIIPSLSYLIKF